MDYQSWVPNHGTFLPRFYTNLSFFSLSLFSLLVCTFFGHFISNPPFENPLGEVIISMEISESLKMYLCKHFQTHYIFNNKKRVVIVMITYSLTISTLLSSPPLFGWGNFAPEENGMRQVFQVKKEETGKSYFTKFCSCAPSWKKPEDASYNLYLFSLGFFLPMGIIIVSSVSILSTLNKVSFDKGKNLILINFS